MSHEVVPETRHQTAPTGRTTHDGARQEGPLPAPDGAPKGLLQQMEELMAALNADLSQLDAELQHATDRAEPAAAPVPGHHAYEDERDRSR
ncbi:hypothetical protein [Streptomyces sp. NPDC058623]|uniref:hypothetical protein n=1 Tax=Streptomyces sp. NPDC058623 TaxID=3346563 RepID=UPI003667CB02